MEDPDDVHTRRKDSIRRSPLFSQPQGTLRYNVKGHDTLDSIALQFGSTPTQLMRLNHLSSRMLFPGQTMYTPDPDSTEPICLSPSSSTKKTFDLPIVSKKVDIPVVTAVPASKSKNKRFLLLKSKSKEERPPSQRKRDRKAALHRHETEPRPGRVIRDHRSQEEDTEESKNFLKLDVKYITDGEGVVSGTMLVTPNAIMFDPNVLDPLVKERGTSPYGVMTQMDCVMGAAMYHDISAMTVSTKTESSTCEPGSCPVYVPTKTPDTNGLASPPTNNATTPTDSSESPRQTTVRTLSQLSDGFVHVLTDLERSAEVVMQASVPERQFDLPEERGVETANELAEISTAAATTIDATSDATSDVSDSSSTEGTLSSCIVDPIDDDDVHERTLDENRRNESLEEGKLTGEEIAASEHILPAGSIGSLPDLVESAELSAKERDSPLPPSDEVPLLRDVSVESTGEKCELDSSDADARSRGFVNFSSGIFARDCDLCAPVPDIAEAVGEAVADPGALERELSEIKAAGLVIRKQSDLVVSGLIDRNAAAEDGVADGAKTDGAKTSTAETSTAGNVETNGTKKEPEPKTVTTDANEEVVLGYNKTNFEEYLPKPAQRYDDPPLYLCLRVGRPMSKTFPGTTSGGRGSSAKHQHKLPEYWFAIPRDKADNLYAFFLQWSPDVYGKDDSSLTDVGFVAVDDALEASLEVIEDFFEEPIGKDWEIITKEEANRRRMTLLECEMNLPLPELEGAASILAAEHVRKLTKQLPARTEGYSWKNIYNTGEHGYSLRNLYRSMTGVDSPVLLVIRDSSGMIFGALTPCPVKVSEHYYGTGETFLFNFVDWDLQVFKWTGENNFFIKGSHNCLTLGGGDGAFGLWMDGDLYRGRSGSCKTFSNPCLAKDEDFIIADLEAWGFSLPY